MLGLTKARSQSHYVYHSRIKSIVPANGGNELRIASSQLPMSAQGSQGASSPIEPTTLLAPVDSIAPGLTIAIPDSEASTVYQTPSELPTLQELISAARKHTSQDEHTLEQADTPGSNWNGDSDDEGASKNPMKELPLGYWRDGVVSPPPVSQRELNPSMAKSCEKELLLDAEEEEDVQPTSFSSALPSAAAGYNEMRHFLSLEELASSSQSASIESPYHCDDSIRSESPVQEHLQLLGPDVQQEDQLEEYPTLGPLAVLSGPHEPTPDAGLSPFDDLHSTVDFLSDFGDDEGCALDTDIGGFEHAPDSPIPFREDSCEINDETTGIPTSPAASLNEFSELLNDFTEHEHEQTETNTEADVATDDNNLQDSTAKTGSRSVKRKWTDEETNDLLRGVVRCGVGNWKTILTQSDLNFTGRSAMNLKDRFRICCPWVYGGQSTKLNDHIDKKIQQFVTTVEGDEADSLPEGDLSKKAKLTLMALGVEDPTTALKATRPARRHFTTEEDIALLRGYRQYGFRWAMIRNDRFLNLQHRKPSDLRDRFRTKYPDVYKRGSGPVGPDHDALMFADTHASYGSEAVNLYTVSPMDSTQELPSSPCQLTGDENATAALVTECWPPNNSPSIDGAALDRLLFSHIADSPLPVVPSLHIPINEHYQTMEWTL
ncbi:hypothetical protein KEM54_000064 [Ascosphaera aggregata]|nr:hypothetical protein KEM54_000064 [Ascosphaera aggregata]